MLPEREEFFETLGKEEIYRLNDVEAVCPVCIYKSYCGLLLHNSVQLTDCLTN